MSKEHYFTRGIFPGTKVKVFGTSPLPADQRDTHIVLREVERLRVVRQGVPKKKWLPFRLVVDGLRVERCVLKMLMNQAVVQRKALEEWEPPTWIPEVVFGLRTLAPKCGLGVVARVGDVISNAEEVGFVFGQSERTGKYESVLLGVLGGWRFLCTWERPLETLGELRFPGGSYSAGEDVLHHLNRYNVVHGPRDLGLSVDFDWSGKWTASKHPNVAALRGKYGPPPR